MLFAVVALIVVVLGVFCLICCCCMFVVMLLSRQEGGKEKQIKHGGGGKWNSFWVKSKGAVMFPNAKIIVFLYFCDFKVCMCVSSKTVSR